MKTFRKLFGVVLSSLAAGLAAQNAPITQAPTVAEATRIPLSPEQLDQLLGPIALYPDALIALILPAATAPADVVLAARYLKERGNDLSQVEHRAWDESVKSLTHYPEIIAWMDENLTWTKQVGDAFAEQPAEVMKAVQRLRARARAAGTLVDTPQQQVLADTTVIRIVPAQPEVIYVPRYDPAVVFVDRPVYYTRPLLSFGVGCRVGSWLAHDFDWHRSTLWVGDRRRHWHGRHDWRQPIIPIASAPRSHHVSRAPRPWQPPMRSTRVYSTVRPAHPGAAHAGPARISSPLHPRPENNLSYRGAAPDRTLPRVPPLHRTPTHVANQVEATVVAPPAPVAAAQQPPSYRSRPADGSRSYEDRGRSYRSPRTTPAALPSVPALQMPSPATRSFPTVVAPQVDRADRGLSSRAARPIPVAPLQRTGPSQPAATEPSSPASSSGEAASQPAPRSQPGPQQRGRRSF